MYDTDGPTSVLNSATSPVIGVKPICNLLIEARRYRPTQSCLLATIMKLLWSLLLLTAALADVTTEDAPVINKTTEVPVDDSLVFRHFVAHNRTMTCSADEHARPFNEQIRGVNLGGWMVLEPWITPSLFYQFLGKGENTTAFDMYTFCEVLGAEEANKQLRRHW